MAGPGWQGGPVAAQPRLTANDFRHEREMAATWATVGIAIVILFVFGALTNVLVGAVLPIILAIVGFITTNLANKGFMVQINEQQFPHLHRMALQLTRNLDMPMPAIFIKQSPIVNAYATGIGHPFTVVFHSALLEQLNEREIATVMAHEFGHIKCRHILYMMLQNITAGPLLGDVLFRPVRWLFFYASRMMEYSADRAALVGTMDIESCVTSELKLAVGAQLYQQMNVQAYLHQMHDFKRSTGSKFIEFLSDRTHPMTVNRIEEVLQFYKDPKYQRLASSHGRAGTSTLTGGPMGTSELFSRVAAKAEYNRDMQRAQTAHGQVAGAALPSAPPTAPQNQGWQQAPSVPPAAPQGQGWQQAPSAPPVAPQNQGWQQAPSAPPAAPPSQSWQQPAPVPVPAPPMPAPSAPAQAQPGYAPMLSCGGCGIPLEPHAKFCARCGTAVAGAQAPSPAPDEQPAAPAAPQVQVVRRVTRNTAPEEK